MYWLVLKMIKDVHQTPSNFLKIISPQRNYTTQVQCHHFSSILRCNSRNVQEKGSYTFVSANPRFFSLSQSLTMSKSKDKGEKKKKVVKASVINLTEVQEVLDVDKYTSQMDYAIEELKNNFVKHLTLRSAAGSIERVSVQFEGEEFLLQDLVQVVHKPKLIVLNVSTFPQAIPQILDALDKSGLNLNPQQDGTTLFVPIPKVTKEYREGLAKNAKSLYIKCRDHIKDVRNKELKKLKRKESISEDQVRRVQSQLEAICDKYVKIAEGILETKQKDLLKTD